MLWTIIVAIVLGAVVGWIANIIMKAGFSMLACVICGIIGSAIGSFLGSLFGLSLTIFGINVMGVILGVVGACLVIFIVRQIKK